MERAKQKLVKVSPAQLKAAREARGAPSGKTSKSTFIRSLPAHLSAEQVMAEGKRQGLSLSRSLVYVVRGRPAPTRGPGRPRGSKNQAPITKSVARSKPARSEGITSPAVSGVTPLVHSREAQLAELVLDLGLDRVEGLLRQLRAALDRV